MSYIDHFSLRAALYAQARPAYPPVLFARLAALCEHHDLAWDCGTGNGQAAIGLVHHFSSVLATDPSPAQLAESPPHARIAFRERSEGACGLASGSVDLVTAAQAAHWFNTGAFYREARRVLRPGGMIAIWCYGLCRVSFTIDEVLDRFYGTTVHPFWAPERAHVESGYRTLPFPFVRMPFAWPLMEVAWSLRDLGSYVQSWSAVANYTRVNGTDPVPRLLEILTPLWGSPDEPRLVRWPVSGYVARL